MFAVHVRKGADDVGPHVIKALKKWTEAAAQGIRLGRPIEKTVSCSVEWISKHRAVALVETAICIAHRSAYGNSVVEETKAVRPGSARRETVAHLQINVKLNQSCETGALFNAGS